MLHPEAQKLLDSVGIDLQTSAFHALFEGSNKPASLSVDGGRIWLDSPYDPLAIPDIKAVPGRAFDTTTKRWSFPATEFQAVYAVTMKHFPETKVQLLKLASATASAMKAQAGTKLVTFEKDGNGWIVRSPYNAKFVEGIKALPSSDRAWRGPLKAWWIKDKQLDTIVKLAVEIYGADKVEDPK